MCDYSLHAQVTRLAVEGEKLVVKRFRGGTIGLAPAIWPPEPDKTQTADQTPWWKRAVKAIWESNTPDPMPAVCVPPGAELVLEGISAPLQKRFSVDAVERVTFTQISMDVAVHRDAVRFRNGMHVSLQELTPGQKVTILTTGGQTAEPALPDFLTVPEPARPAHR